MKIQFLGSNLTKPTPAIFGVLSVVGILSFLSLVVSPDQIAVPFSSAFGSGALFKILADPIAVIELIALVWSSIYLFGLLVGNSSTAPVVQTEEYNFVIGHTVRLGAPAPSVQRAIRSGSSTPTPVVNVGGVITRSML